MKTSGWRERNRLAIESTEGHDASERIPLSTDMTDILHKIIFKLTPDEDDYPPFAAESVWGIYRGGDVYEIDNTPYGLDYP